MDKRFYKSCVIDKFELDVSTKVLEDYMVNQSEEYLIASCLIDEAKRERDSHYSVLYKTIEDTIKGIVVADSVSDMFPIATGNSEAMAIMNSKASVFDVNQLNVELKQVNVELSAITEEEARATGRDETFISIFNRILNESYLPKPQYKFCFSDAIKYSRGYPMSISLIGWDDNAILGSETNFTGDITCENIPLDSFYWDPSANDIDNCEYVWISKILPYRKIDDFVSKLKIKNLKLLEAFYITENSTSPKTNGTSDLANNQVLINNGAIELITIYKKEVKDKKTKIKLYHVVGGTYVIAEQVYDIPYLPFSILKEHGVPNSFTGVSSVMLALPHIKQKYFIDGVCNNIALTMKNPIYLVSNSSGINGGDLIDYSTTDAGKAITTNDNPQTSVALVQSPSIQNDMLVWRQQLDAEISKAINASDINNFGSKLSGSAVQNVIEQSTIKENTSIVELEKYLVRFVRIMLSFIKVKLSEKKGELTFRAKVTKDTNDSQDVLNEFISLTGDEFVKLEADILIDTSLLRTSKQQKQQQDLLQLYQMELQYKGKADITTLKDIVISLNLPNKEAVISRMIQESEQNKAQQAVQLVEGVTQLMQMPEAAELGVEEATMIVLQQLQEQGGNK